MFLFFFRTRLCPVFLSRSSKWDNQKTTQDRQRKHGHISRIVRWKEQKNRNAYKLKLKSYTCVRPFLKNINHDSEGRKSRNHNKKQKYAFCLSFSREKLNHYTQNHIAKISVTWVLIGKQNEWYRKHDHCLYNQTAVKQQQQQKKHTHIQTFAWSNVPKITPM